MQQNSRIGRLIIGGLFAFCVAGPAYADRYWNTNGSGDFFDTANWSDSNGGGSGFSVPDQTQPTFYELAGASPYTVSFSASAGADSVTVNNNDVTLDLNGNEYSLAQTGGPTHQLNVTGGGGLAAVLRVTDGTLRQVDPPTNNNTGNFLTVDGGAGASNSAELIVDTGGVVWTGQTAIGGNSNTSTANTRLTIQNGGKYYGTSNSSVGGAGNAPGSIVITGAGSQMQVYGLTVGGNATATLDINSGGVLTVRTPPNLLYAPDRLLVGSLGTATLNGGIIELNGSTGGTFDFFNTFRGSGTIRRAAGATGLSDVFNSTYNPSGYFGKFHVGDISATPAVGTVTLEDANYGSDQVFGSTGAFHSVMYLDLASPTSYDQLLLTDPGADDGVVTATLAGSILFNNINPIDFTSGTVIDFIRAENIVDAGFTTNIASVASAWTFNGGPSLSYTLGIVTVAPNDVRFRLVVLPEPASMALLAAGSALMLVRRRRV